MDVSTEVSRDVHHVFASYFKGSEVVAYALSRALAEGSICLDVEKYKSEINILEEAARKAAEDAAKEAGKQIIDETIKESKKAATAAANPFWEGELHFDQQLNQTLWVAEVKKDQESYDLKPFIRMKGQIYLQRYFEYETRIINDIKRLGNNFRIITGGPGTGKTFGVAKELVKLLASNPSLKIAMAAPTGKAAARMEESIRKFVGVNKAELEEPVQEILATLTATTIHSLLGYIHNSVFFRHNEKNKLPYDVVIVDEASMIDGAMMAKLLNAIDAQAILFLIGDKNQLASVEAGSVFGDICRAVVEDEDIAKFVKQNKEDVMAGKAEEAEVYTKTINTGGKIDVKLKNHRTEGQHIISFSKNLIEGNEDFIHTYKNNEEIIIDKPADGKFSEELFREKVMLYMKYIEEGDISKALQKLNLVRVLCVTREHDNSVAQANSIIEKLLKEEIKDSGVFSPRKTFYNNQPIIITKNDRELGLNNGDVGIVRKTGDVFTAYFEGQEGQVVEKKAAYLNHYETAFAMTIHKSQGSEFDNVVVLLPKESGGKLLTRELLYTAVTRAKQNVLIQSTPEVLRLCVEREVSRASGITQRLKNNPS